MTKYHYVTEAAVLARLAAVVKAAGTQRAAAMQLAISAQQLGEITKGTRPVNPKTLAALGFERVTLYRRVVSP